ncbi:MAG: hypothetical protein HY321_02270 [Armatimonadetes bacterium]|nr:hypothetical protein [Armatimonadota bacterium]
MRVVRSGWALMGAVAVTIGLPAGVEGAEAGPGSFPRTDLSRLRFPERHPFVFYTRAEVAAVRERVRQPGAWQQKEYAAGKRRFDALLLLPPAPGEERLRRR